MKLLLTGGTGFFGKSLLRHWLGRHLDGQLVPQVCVLSRDPTKLLANHPEFSGLHWLRFTKGDVMDKLSLPWGEHFSHVLHAAADSTLGPTLSPLDQYDQIVTGTRHLLDFARDSGAQRFLFTSSGAVYGRQPDELSQVSEDWLAIPDPLLPSSAYGIAKRAAEHLCSLYHLAYGLETVIARCFAFVGEDLPLNAHFAIGNFIRDALQANAITINGDGSPVRSYLDQRELAEWLLVMLERGRAGQGYNLGSDQAITIAELAHLVRDTLAPSKPIHIQRTELGGPRNRYVPSISKAANELGLRVTVPLVHAILNAAGNARKLA